MFSGLRKYFVYKGFEQKAGNRRTPGPDLTNIQIPGRVNEAKIRVGMVNKRQASIKMTATIGLNYKSFLLNSENMFLTK